MFDDIRPYRDDEVNAVVKRLLTEEELLTSIAGFTYPKLSKILPSLARSVMAILLKIKLRHVNTVDALQLMVAKLLKKLLQKTSSGLSFDGLQNLDLTRPTLFVSNHRDIALDPALVNLALFESKVTTVEIAIGDNLLAKGWITDIMRLNKSFIVKRSEKKKRAMLMASKQLSAYIHYTLTEKHQHIWIAQREGRAKDGLDKTNSAVISMFLLNKPKATSIGDYLDQLNIVPVSIAYEFDPCDRKKAKELAEIENKGNYQKQELEDIQSIVQGMRGQKGNIHIQFGEPVRGDYKDSKTIADAIDSQIISNYRLFETHQTAHALLNQPTNYDNESKLAQRLDGLNDNQKKWLLTMYANPVFAKQVVNKKS